MARKALGRGLEALLGVDNVDELKTSGEIIDVNIDEIIPNELQPRKYFDDEKLEELSESIKEKGIIQPIVVTKTTDKYEIIVGERRWRAAKKVGLETLPVIVRDI